MQTIPATSLSEIIYTLSPEPLSTPEELAAFYREEVNDVRGKDKVKRVELRLNQSFKRLPCKVFLMGHPGVGKSTELTRLIYQVEDKFCTIRIEADKVLDQSHFKAFDVLLLMMSELFEKTARPIAAGGTGWRPPAGLLRKIKDWLASETTIHTQKTALAMALEAGAGPEEKSLWQQILGLFASLKGEIKYASTREKKVVEYRLSRLDSLIDLANQLLDACNQHLLQASQREWLFIWENFDKGGFSPLQTEELFLAHGKVFRDLRTHLIFNLPISLGYSSRAVQLPPFLEVTIPDTPVFQPDRTPHVRGREVLAAVLEARVQPELFEPGEMMRLIVASGGNLRDLFVLCADAADSALLRGTKTIEATDVEAAIADLRVKYRNGLGQSEFDADKIAYDDKAVQLTRIYHQEEEAKIPDPVLYSLLLSRAVLEFNGERWFGVHPLVVDILEDQKRIEPDAGGRVRGGTRWHPTA